MQLDLDRAAPDLTALAVLVLSFASLVTVHLALAYRLVRLGPAWRGVLALVLPPLAPLWGLSQGLRLLPILWLATGAGYLVALSFAAT